MLGDRVGIRRFTLQAGLLLSLLLAFTIRVTDLGFQSFWGDEEFTVRFSSLPLTEILQEIVKQGEPHPPLYYYIIHFWLQLVGKSDFAVRFSTVLPGVLSVALIYVLGTKLFNRSVGFIAACFLTVNPFFVYHGQEARMYPLAMMLGLASTYFLILILRPVKFGSKSVGGRKYYLLLWTAYVVASTLSIYIHYYTVFVIVFQNLYVAVLLVRERAVYFRWVLTRWVPAQLTIIGLFTPWLFWGWQIINSYGGQGSTTDFISAPKILFPIFSLGWSLDPQLRAELSFGYLAIFVIALIAGSRFHRESLLILLLYLLVPIMSVITVALQRQIFGERQLIATLPAFILILSYGVYSLLRVARKSALGVILPLMGVTAFAYVLVTASIPLRARHSDMTYMNADFRGMANFVADFVQPDDALIFEVGHGDVLFSYYYKGPEFSTYYQFPDIVKGFPVGAEKVLEGIAAKHQRLWLVLYAAKQVDPGDVVERWLDDNTFKAYNSYFGIGRLVLYETGGGLKETPASVNYANGVLLDKVGIDPQIKAGDVLRVKLLWQVIRPPTNDFRVVLRLIDSRGHLVSQIDRLPKDGYLPIRLWQPSQQIDDNYGLFLSPALIPGSYKLEATLYEPSSGWQSTITPLGTIQVDGPGTVLPVRALGISQPLMADLGNGLTLVDAHIPQQMYQPGDILPVEILWGADKEIGQGIDFKLRLVDEAGKVLDEKSSTMASEVFPMSKWRAGELVRDFADLTLGPKIQSGTYRVLAVAGTKEVSLGEVKVKSRERIFQEPSPPNRSDAFFGQSIQLIGWGTDNTLAKTGEPLAISLYWKATGSINENYNVFVHVLDSHGKVVAQHDGGPANGIAKTAGWLEGEYITDRHEISLGKDIPPGHYTVEIGLYRPDTGVRLKTDNGEDRLILSEIDIE